MSENIEEKAAVAVEATPAAEPAKAAAPAEKRKKGGRMVPSGIAYVLATFNNTKVTFTVPGSFKEFHCAILQHRAMISNAEFMKKFQADKNSYTLQK